MDSHADSFFSVGLDLPTGAVRSRRKVLHDQLKAAIVDGRLAPGLKLPASRALAQYLGVSRNSIVAVYELLLSGGYIVARQGAGSYTAQTVSWVPSLTNLPDPQAALRLSARWQTQAPVYMTKPRLAIDLTLGAPDIDLFPHDIWRRLLSHANRRPPDRSGENNTPCGIPILRQAIARHVSVTRAVACNAKDVLITHGAQQAFDLLARILVDPGRTEVAVEDPGYPPVRATFAAAGALIHTVRVDCEGLVIDDIPSTATVIYVTPSHQFPLGVPMSPRRRLQLLEFADAPTRSSSKMITTVSTDFRTNHSLRCRPSIGVNACFT